MFDGPEVSERGGLEELEDGGSGWNLRKGHRARGT